MAVLDGGDYVDLEEQPEITGYRRRDRGRGQRWRRWNRSVEATSDRGSPRSRRPDEQLVEALVPLPLPATGAYVVSEVYRVGGAPSGRV
ncbi:hypothetical protein [Micromonospora sp. NPDC023888]|uniref:hypothetical protein n=1 Tax=Micromonospora sp. NPDC023888 TaxID=3155607 RepID=UPI0033E1D6B1